MTTLIWLFVALGVAPLTAGAMRMRQGGRGISSAPHLGGVLLCALAFNLTFFWQELWLVIPKALAGLHPILFHNNHDWKGSSPLAELLQGAGALATLGGGLGFSAILRWRPNLSPTWRSFAFWMAFQGLFQALTQFAIGTMIPGNDVGRALSYLGMEGAARWALLLADILAMAVAGGWLAGRYPVRAEASGAGRPRALVWQVVATLALATALIVPFRIPRDVVEVALVPLFINLVGAGWVILGASRTAPGAAAVERPAVIGPALALVGVLLVFQLVLRPGIAF